MGEEPSLCGADGVPRVVLVGMMGSGKTTVGRLVAQRLGWPHCDSDAQVVADTGRSIPEIFSTDGETAFRAEESRVLIEAVGGTESVVVSAAGGAVLSAANRCVMAGAGAVVWLRAQPATLARRVGDGRGRPLLGDDPLRNLESLEAERRPRYQEVATVVVDVDGLSPGDVADRVLTSLGLAPDGLAGR